MDTQGLRLFVRAAEKLNISAAGKELGMAPAVASAKLAKLERQMGADLLHRSTRKVALSLEGSEFLPFAREIIAQEDAALAVLGKSEAQASGTLRFTAPSSFAQLFIAPILPDFLAEYPKVTLDLRLSDMRFDLIEGSFDLALRNAVLEDTSLKGRKLASDRRILCASPDYLAAHGTPQHPDDLQAHHLLGFNDSRPSPLRQGTNVAHMFDPAVGSNRLIMDDGTSQRIATRAGAGISANSVWSVCEDIRTGALVRVLPDYHIDRETDLWLMYPKANVLSAKVRVFMDFLLDRIGKAPPWAHLL